MSVLELKGELHELIATVQNEELLKKIKTALKKLTAKEAVEAENFALTPEQEAELMISLEESYDETKTITFDEFKLQNARWLKE